MADPNVNWARWILASASKQIAADIASFGVPIFIEGQTEAFDPKSERIEFRIAGPHIRELSKDEWRIDCVINLLYSIAVIPDFHRPQRVAGVLANALRDICVYRYGDGAGDDNTFLGTLSVLQDSNHQIRTNPFGQIAPDILLNQGTVEGGYRMYLP